MNRRVLIVDDTKGIHDDFKKILTSSGPVASGLASARAAFFGETPSATTGASGNQLCAEVSYDLTYCFQGLEALEFARSSVEEESPFAVAFVDVRMPPGIDGVQTIKRLWEIDPNIQCVICSAFSDYSWQQMIDELGHTDKLLILKKPFDPTEICQIASAFTEKWNAANREQKAIALISQKEVEARAYASSLETLNKALATAKASADRTSEMKSDFIMRLTTEMSTHLNAILDRLIENDEVTGLDDALDRSQRLLGMINKVIDFTQVELGSLILADQQCDLRAVLNELGERHAPSAAEKGLDLRFEVAQAVPDIILTDPHRLIQILSYLVENAVQYTETGSVAVRLLREPTGCWDTVRLRFEVEDTGCGVDGDLSGKIFEPFASSADGRFMDRSGLGLTVATRVARLMGGEVSFTSTTGVGTTFTLELEVKTSNN
jgi:signal transduction histidine kinase